MALNASRIPASLSCAEAGGDYCALATPHRDCGGVRAGDLSGFPPQLNDLTCPPDSCVDVAGAVFTETLETLLSI